MSRRARTAALAGARAAAALAAAALVAAARPAGATGFTDLGQDLVPRAATHVAVTGGLRFRGEALYNLDLDRGLTPSGLPLFPTPLADPAAQTLTTADTRLRADLALYPAFGGVAVKVRVDVLDNVALGEAPAGPPQGATTQEPPARAFRLKRAYGEALTPVGVIAAGRLGAHFGLGLLANGGDCPDCDSGDAGDRIALISPLAGLIWGIAFDVSSTGPVVARRDGARVIDPEPSDDVRTVTFAFLRWRDPAARERRRRAGRVTVEYGAHASYRWQERDVPASYLPIAQPPPLEPAQVMARGFAAAAFDGWFRLTLPTFRLEAEAALLLARVEQPSLLPGVLLRDEVRGASWGGALESEWGGPGARLLAGIDAGVASGDPAPGFGAFPRAGAAAARPGDLDGPQAVLPRDTRIDNFRFHPDYRVDRILWRELVGTVTDAIYVRPHARWRAPLGAGVVEASLAAIASWAMEPASTPGGARVLGLELDPTLTYASRDGFVATLEHAILIPFAGLSNPTAGLPARPAQLVRLRLEYLF